MILYSQHESMISTGATTGVERERKILNDETWQCTHSLQQNPENTQNPHISREGAIFENPAHK